jgi:hypothetical protein
MSTSVSSKPLELIFSDVWGPAPDSIGRKKYYVSFIDDFGKFTWIYLLQFKSKVFQKFLELQKMVERLFDTKIVAMQTRGLNSFLTQMGVTQYVSCPHAHQQNGPAERKHRHIVEVALALLAHASMPLKFWDEAVATAAYLINRTPSKILGFSTPLECLFKQQPDYMFLKIFGCACWPNLRPYNNHKLAFRSKHCVFLGYSSIHKGYKCLEVLSGRVYISRDVIFDEKAFLFTEFHSNAGARLHAEINLLPTHLLPSSNVGPRGTNLTDDSLLQNNLTPVYNGEICGEFGVQMQVGEEEQGGVDSGIEHEEDFVLASSVQAGESASCSAPTVQTAGEESVSGNATLQPPMSDTAKGHLLTCVNLG